LSVLQVATGFPSWGGTELHILNLSEQLRLRGYDVTVACRPGCWVEERAQQMGLPTVPIRVMRQGDWQDFGRLRRYLRENKTDVMHVHWSLDMVVPGFAARLEDVPVRILSRHMPYPFKNRLGTMLYSRYLFTRMVTVSNSVRETLLRCGVANEKIEVIHHGTDVEAFSRTTLDRKVARHELGIPDDSVAVGIVGRIAPEKGHRVLLEAMRKLDGRYPVCLVVVGTGPDEQLIQDSAANLGLSDKIIFAGFRDDVNNAINAMDVVTVPSTWNEPCSAVIQQGMALSKPVIGTRTGGSPEMIVEDVTGYLVPPFDPDALADAIARLSGDAFLRKRLGTAGRERVEELFSLRVMTDKIEALYHREYENARGAGVREKALV
ncbi:MAG: glycosyltransferase family 4 protein, partial [Armatimonadota bacterium]|nr:glycosyltransferase family 4 protein [Armatimonadota bacterium]